MNSIDGMRQSSSTNNPKPTDLPTLAGLGIVAYVSQTLAHEALGHGGACLLIGGKVTLIAPLFMNCTLGGYFLTAAGPAANVIVGALCLTVLRLMPVPRAEAPAGALHFFLWLSLACNWLVAAGYLVMGALTGFGDWQVLFAWVSPQLAWRLPAVAIGAFLYARALILAGRALARLNGVGVPTWAEYVRLVLVPFGTAALVAMVAVGHGQGLKPGGLALAFSTTLGVGLTLAVIGRSRNVTAQNTLRIALNRLVVVLAVIVAAGFIFVIGPGLNLSER